VNWEAAETLLALEEGAWMVDIIDECLVGKASFQLAFKVLHDFLSHSRGFILYFYALSLPAFFQGAHGRNPIICVVVLRGLS
jgi:hypothetical protein